MPSNFKVSSYPTLYTNKFPSFDTLDELTAYAVKMGATHIELGNYHEGAFFRAENPTDDMSSCDIMHFGCRYDVKVRRWKTILHYLGIKRQEYHTKGPIKDIVSISNIGWYCYGVWENWFYGEKVDLNPRYVMYPFVKIGDDNIIIKEYLNNMRNRHDFIKPVETK
jgi:hypothetical protein